MYSKLLDWVGTAAQSCVRKNKLTQAQFWVFIGKLLAGGSNYWTLDYEAVIAWNLGNYDAAIEKSRQVLTLESDDRRARCRIPLCLVRLGRWNEAIELGNKLNLTAEFGGFPYQLGVELFESEADPLLALPWFEIACKEDFDKEWAPLYQAHCWLKAQSPDKARSIYFSLLKDAKNVTVKFHAELGVAESLYALGHLSQARNVAKAAMAHANDLKLRSEDVNYGKTVLTRIEEETQDI